MVGALAQTMHGLEEPGTVACGGQSGCRCPVRNVVSLGPQTVTQVAACRTTHATKKLTTTSNPVIQCPHDEIDLPVDASSESSRMTAHQLLRARMVRFGAARRRRSAFPTSEFTLSRT
jgi:hypothetical protein